MLRLRAEYGFLLVVDDAHATLVCEHEANEHGASTLQDSEHRTSSAYTSEARAHAKGEDTEGVAREHIKARTPRGFQVREDTKGVSGETRGEYKKDDARTAAAQVLKSESLNPWTLTPQNLSTVTPLIPNHSRS